MRMSLGRRPGHPVLVAFTSPLLEPRSEECRGGREQPYKERDTSGYQAAHLASDPSLRRPADRGRTVAGQNQSSPGPSPGSGTGRDSGGPAAA
jgi:hypothetical protein